MRQYEIGRSSIYTQKSILAYFPMLECPVCERDIFGPLITTVESEASFV